MFFIMPHSLRDLAANLIELLILLIFIDESASTTPVAKSASEPSPLSVLNTTNITLANFPCRVSQRFPCGLS